MGKSEMQGVGSGKLGMGKPIGGMGQWNAMKGFPKPGERSGMLPQAPNIKNQYDFSFNQRRVVP